MPVHTVQGTVVSLGVALAGGGLPASVRCVRPCAASMPVLIQQKGGCRDRYGVVSRSVLVCSLEGTGNAGTQRCVPCRDIWPTA